MPRSRQTSAARTGNSAVAKRRWRRADLIAANGRPVDDDYCLLDDAGQAVARIYKVRGGPYDGHWFYALQVDEQGRPWNAGTGYCATGREAKQICEAMAARLVLAD